MFGLDPVLSILLLVCIIAVCVFEFVNGFHDTANAVATVIYTKSLKPTYAILLSGSLNFLGVLFGGVSVAMGIVKLMPLDAIIDQTVYQTVAMIMAMIVTAILWNLGTWYFGIPCSSSHTLLASILGVCLTFSLLPESHGAGMDWSKASEIGFSLLFSPLVGFILTLFIMFIFKVLVQDKTIFKEPSDKKETPTWIKSILIATCSGVSFAHGSNDGQKGVGLLMLVLIAIIPAQFALNGSLDISQMKNQMETVQTNMKSMDSVLFRKDDKEIFSKAKNSVLAINQIFHVSDSLKSTISANEKVKIRKELAVFVKNIDILEEKGYDKDFDQVLTMSVQKTDYKGFKSNVKEIKKYIEYVPNWVLVLISVCLGLGTMIGWKRIVVTIGEKIGKDHLTYAQGASAELAAASTIAFSTFAMKLPVSTTQILSSGIAGAMVGSKGVGNLRLGTLKSIALAWILTFPVCVTMSGLLYYVFRIFA
ncbi:MAG: inorganic phosphate transporter [Cytophagales bacterium]